MIDWWRHLDPAVAGGIVGAIVGGFFTIAGGFGGAWLVGWLDGRREERQQVREHGAAVRAVIYELTTLLAGITLVLDHKTYVAIDTPDWAYRAVFMVLIARLPEALAQNVAFAYSQLSILRYHLNDGAKGSSMNFDAIQIVERSIGRAQEALRMYARTLKIDVEAPARDRKAAMRSEHE
ncbi:MAG: hypothetical protein E6J20_11930 [Chloroflexi bacterium]|nr:MAG: hypothetical protein E6J20_11930 [Chloroflexota bacterium]